PGEGAAPRRRAGRNAGRSIGGRAAGMQRKSPAPPRGQHMRPMRAVSAPTLQPCAGRNDATGGDKTAAPLSKP
ncbi:hypothetical protein HMPREF0731_1027, partial [Pseudoroseomonas cervicalis ATCC 49957]